MQGVKAINIADGKACGVTLEDGSVIEGKIVLSNATPKVTFQDLMEEGQLPGEFMAHIKSFDYTSPVFKLNGKFLLWLHFKFQRLDEPVNKQRLIYDFLIIAFLFTKYGIYRLILFVLYRGSSYLFNAILREPPPVAMDRLPRFKHHANGPGDTPGPQHQGTIHLNSETIGMVDTAFNDACRGAPSDRSDNKHFYP